MVTRRGLLQLGGAMGLAPTGLLTTPHHDFNTRALRTALDEMVTATSIGALAEVRERAHRWSAASGESRLGTGEPVPAAGRFRTGSITKTFVATVVLQLAGEGRLSLDDRVRRWLPDIVPDAGRITLRQLLQHTSGVRNYTATAAFEAVFGGPADVARLRDRTWTPRELLGFLDDPSLLFEPGTDWRYSNTNYLLLGLVVERVTGRTYAQEIRRRILGPLALRHTAVPGTDSRLRGPHPHGYLALRAGGIDPVDITDFNPSVAGASGEMVSTAADLNAFLRALIGGRLLRPAEQREMLTAYPAPTDYGYGLGLMTVVLPGGTRLWGHRGDIFGYYAESWTTGDGRRQCTVAATPYLDTKPKPAVTVLLRAAFEPG
jgi:D-alanyl-D-alanine carboxypeptidase